MRTPQTWLDISNMQNQRLLEIISNLPQAIFVIDEQNIILFSNQTARNILPNGSVGHIFPETLSMTPREISIGSYLLNMQIYDVIWDTDQQPAHMVVLHDITAQRQADLAIKDNLAALQAANQEIALLDEMNQMLQASLDIKDVMEVGGSYITKLIPGSNGALYVRDGEAMHQKAEFGRQHLKSFAPDDCWSYRLGKRYAAVRDDDPACNHVKRNKAVPYICVPLIVNGAIAGIIHARLSRKFDILRSERLLDAISSRLALSVNNLQLRTALIEQSVRDPLTKLFNRRYMEETLQREMQRAQRNHTKLGLVISDVDHFKKFNDTYGHLAGDAVLQGVADLLGQNVRREDVVCRYGGEEFVVIFPGISAGQAASRAEIIREQLNKQTFTYDNQELKVTASFGVSEFPACDSIETLIEAADNALYESKKAGRNRVTIAGGK